MYQLTPEDLTHVSTTPQAAAEKFSRLAAGERTDLLKQVPAKLKAILDGRQSPPPPPRVIFQCFMGHNYFRRPQTSEREAEFAARFTEMGISDWAVGVDYLPRSAALVGFLRRTGFPVTWIWRVSMNPTAWRIGRRLKEANSPEPMAGGEHPVKIGHRDHQVAGRLNLLSGDVVEQLAQAAAIEIAELVTANPTTTAVILTTELPTAVIPGEVSREVARLAGVDELILWPPDREPAGEPYQAVIDPADPVHDSLAWHYVHRNQAWLHEIIGGLVKPQLPDLELVQDSQYNLYDVCGVDRIQSWAIVDLAPAIPLKCAWLVELALAKRRALGTPSRIVVGPQLGEKNLRRIDDTTYTRPCPPDLYSAACWCSLGFGSTGLVSWGIGTVFEADGGFMRDENGAEIPTGPALWQRVLDVREKLCEPLADLILRWEPAPRRTAVLYPIADKDLYCSGWNHQGNRDAAGNWIPAAVHRGWVNRRAIHNVFCATLLAGEPCDVVFDTESFDAYDVLIVPCLYVASAGLIRRLAEFQKRGGTLIVHPGSALESDEGATAGWSRDLEFDGAYSPQDAHAASLAPYFADYGPGTYGQHYQFLDNLAADLRGRLLPDGSRFGRRACLGAPLTVCNEMRADGRRYLVMINHDFIAGPEAAWLESVGGGVGKSADVGVPHAVANPTGRELVDQLSGERFDGGAFVRLEPGWGRVLEILEPDTMPYTLTIPADKVRRLKLDETALRVDLTAGAVATAVPGDPAGDPLRLAWDARSGHVVVSSAATKEPAAA